MEMERLYNHIGDLGNICAGVGLAFGSSHGARIKERLQRVNKYLVGHRFLRGINKPGGLKFDLPADFKAKLNKELVEIEKDTQELVEILLENVIFLNRINITGIITLENVRDLAVVGPAARGAGWNRDCRKIHPYGVYKDLEFEVPTDTTGDVASRFRIRYFEAIESFKIIRQILRKMPQGSISIELGNITPYQFALGFTESARGENMHWLMTGENNTIFRYRIRSASYPNWPVVPLAVRGNIVPDFPLINKSFELCYACLDR
jgi:Ni,Fe-hydrogenase III large subunit